MSRQPTKPKPTAPKARTTSAAPSQSRVISENRKATFKYEILEQVECGIMLVGSEVKSLRENRVSLDEAYARIRSAELWLVSADIAAYRQASIWNHEPRRVRKLLVHKRQLNKLIMRAREKGLTLIPLRMLFNDRGIIKVVVGVCKGKKLHDKRESLKKADAKRSIARESRRR